MTKQDISANIADIETFLDMAKECVINGDNKGADTLLRRVVNETKRVIFHIPKVGNEGRKC